MRTDGLTDERLREAYQRVLAARGGRGRERCPTPEALLAVLRREGPEERRLETVDHVMGCAACRSEFDLLRSIEQAGAGTERAGATVLRLFQRPAWRSVAPVALAASVLLIVVAGQKLRSRETPDVERGTADMVLLLGPAPEIAAGAPITFAWGPVPGARGYELEVLDGQGSVVLAEKTAETSLTLRDDPRLVPGATYRWWVRAITASGDRRSSVMRSLRVRTK